MSLTSKKIQGRSTKPLSVEETAEKVRALREKQSMWMKERETEKSSLAIKTRKDSKNSEFSSESSKLNERTNGRTSSRSLSSSESRHSEGRNPYSNPRRKPLYPEPKRDHSEMISWIAKGPAPFSRESKRPPSGSGHHSRHNSTSSKTLTRDGTRNSTGKSAFLSSKEYKASNYSISQKNSLELAAQSQQIHNKQRPQSRSSLHGEGKVENTIDPKNDNEEVISTHQSAKNDFSHSDLVTKLQTAHIPPEMLAALTDTLAQRLQGAIPMHGSQAKKSFPAPDESNRRGIEQGMASHFCSLCDELMTAPRHTPMAVIPCGHSFCKACLRDCWKCPSCQTKVNSTAVNTVLQAIIVDFTAQKEKERLQQLEEETRKYVDEYQSLCMRHNALTAEAECILETMESTTELLMEQKKKSKKLGMDKQSLREKIQELQEHLNKITSEEEKCERKCEELELNYNEEKDRLAMAEDTVKMINKSKERVKMLVQNFAPSLNLDEMFKE